MINNLNKKYYKEVFHSIGLIAQLGLTMVINILVMFFIGLFIDRHWQLKGVVIAIFIFLGVITGAFSCYKLLKKYENKK